MYNIKYCHTFITTTNTSSSILQVKVINLLTIDYIVIREKISTCGCPWFEGNFGTSGTICCVTGSSCI